MKKIKIVFIILSIFSCILINGYSYVYAIEEKILEQNKIENEEVEEENNIVKDDDLDGQEKNEEKSKNINGKEEVEEQVKTLSGTSVSKELAEGIYEIELGLNSNKVIEVIDASRISGANVQVYSRNGAMCQRVEIKSAGQGYYTIKFVHSGKYLDVANGEKKDGTNVWQCTGNGSDAQKWKFVYTQDGYYQIISKCSNKYLTVTGKSDKNCTNIEINSDKNAESQKFKLKEIQPLKGEKTIEEGIYDIELALDSSKVLEVVEAKRYSGANVQIYNRNNAKCQSVEIKYVGDGYYTIKFRHSEKYLDVADAGTANGTNVWQCTENHSDAQKWVIRRTNDGYYQIISKCSETYLTVAGSKNKNGTNIEINTDKGDKSQKFKFQKREIPKGEKTIEDGSYEIELGLNSEKVVEVTEAYTYSGANVQIFRRSNVPCQTVDIKYIGDGYYTIKFKHSGKYLDVANGETAYGTNVWQCTENYSDAQKWIIRSTNDGYYQIISKCSETYLTVAGGKIENCTNIEINGLQNNKSQKFKFNKSRVLTGIDVSRYQGVIDWTKVKNSGIDFAIIRCGYGENVTSQDDSRYLRNVTECERLGIPYGIYIYSYALNVQGARSEAEHVLRLVKGHNPAMGIWFDMEDADDYKLRNGMPSNETLINICTTFCDIIRANGYNVGIYASKSWMYEKLNDDARLDKYDKWIAQWNTTCTYKKKFIMWQYSSKGVVDGINGYVDMDRYYL